MARNKSGGGGSSCLGTLITTISGLFIVFILLGAAGIVAILAQPSLAGSLKTTLNIGTNAGGPATPTLLAIAVAPTADDPNLGPNGLIATWTPAPRFLTLEPTATNTRRPTSEPTVTPTFPPPTNTPTNTPTPTFTPTPTLTPTLGPPPTATNTRSPYPFTKSDTSPMYLQNFANNAGCNWLGIAGEVLDLNMNPVPAGQYRVHVWGSGIDERVPVGGAPAYGPSGYEQFVFNAPVVRDYNVQLETTSGTAVSQAYTVQTRASCNQNLLLFNFVQNHS